MEATQESSARPASNELWLGRVFFKYRDLLFPLAVLGLALGTPPSLFLGDVRADMALDVFAVALALFGQSIRAATIGLQYISRGGKNKEIYAKRLVVGGVFSHCRNPMYLGNILGIAGMMLVHNGIWMYAIGVPYFALAYGTIIASEERYLRSHFGAEYDEYCRQVPRLTLRLKGLATTLRSAPFEWKRVVRKEYGTTFAGATALIGLLLWERVRLPEYADENASTIALIALWLALLIGYVTARKLKHQRVLEDAH